MESMEDQYTGGGGAGKHISAYIVNFYCNLCFSFGIVFS